MEKVCLGKTGLMVSRVGFGGIPIQRLSENEAVRVVQKCLELGVNFLDTANGYSTSEERIGKAVKGRRQDVIIASKSGARDPAELQKHLELSLKRLDTDYLDLYQFHNVTKEKAVTAVLESDGLIDVLEKARKDGKIRHIGLSSHQIDAAKKAVATERFETIMFPFSFIDIEAEKELLPLARKLRVGFIAMKPLAGGELTDARIAFKYIFSIPDVVPIPGIEKISEIEEIVSILESPLALTRAEKAKMIRIKKEMGSRFCHRCDYCQPCPAEIPISAVMHYPSSLKRLPPQQLFTRWMPLIMEKAEGCTKCRACEERCPYQLKITDTIAEYARHFRVEEARFKAGQEVA